MRKSIRFTIEQKIKASIDYLSGLKSAKQIEQELQMGRKGTNAILIWAKKYELFGESAFIKSKFSRHKQ